MIEESNAVKQAADLLKGGATMLADTCPACGTPLFKIGNEIKCPKCNKPVVIVTGTEDETKLLKARVLDNTEQTLLKKVSDIQLAIQKENDPETLRKLTENLTGLLSALERLRHG